MAPPDVDSSTNPADIDDADDESAAEAKAALADERARQARARADELRRQAQGLPAPTTSASDAPKRRGWRLIAVGAGAFAFCALLGLGSALTWDHHVAQAKRDQIATAAAVARQGVTDLMALNFINADEDVQRILNNSTGHFRQDFAGQQYLLVKNLERSKAVTKVDITGIAVQSATADSAEVLVAATVQAANVANPHASPKRFRVAVSLTKDAGRLKISQLSFI